MSKENEIELMSFTEKGQRWLQCKVCYDYKKVDEDTHEVTCSSCTMKKALALKPLDEFFAKRDPSPEEIEEGAKLCEQHGEIFPQLFKDKNLTRKVIVLPKQIRELRIANLMLRLEEEGEHLHQVFNSLEIF